MALAQTCTGLNGNYKSASGHNVFDFDKEYSFDKNLLEYFGYKNVQSVNDVYQENFEKLEVLMARILYKIDDELQKRVDTLIDDTYTKAIEYYKSQGIKWDTETKGPPPVIGIHIDSEYLLSINLLIHAMLCCKVIIMGEVKDLGRRRNGRKFIKFVHVLSRYCAHVSQICDAQNCTPFPTVQTMGHLHET